MSVVNRVLICGDRYWNHVGMIKHISVQLTFYRILIPAIGIVLSFVWLSTQQRSSSYIHYYKKQANILSKKTNTPPVFPPNEIKGKEVRKVLYCLPICFIVFLSLFVISQVIFFYYPNGVNPFEFLAAGH